MHRVARLKKRRAAGATAAIAVALRCAVGPATVTRTISPAIRRGGARLYLAEVLDLFSRQVVGWAV